MFMGSGLCTMNVFGSLFRLYPYLDGVHLMNGVCLRVPALPGHVQTPGLVPVQAFLACGLARYTQALHSGASESRINEIVTGRGTAGSGFVVEKRSTVLPVWDKASGGSMSVQVLAAELQPCSWSAHERDAGTVRRTGTGVHSPRR
jgi:hypothetical protein